MLQVLGINLNPRMEQNKVTKSPKQSSYIKMNLPMQNDSVSFCAKPPELPKNIAEEVKILKELFGVKFGLHEEGKYYNTYLAKGDFSEETINNLINTSKKYLSKLEKKLESYKTEEQASTYLAEFFEYLKKNAFRTSTETAAFGSPLKKFLVELPKVENALTSISTKTYKKNIPMHDKMAEILLPEDKRVFIGNRYLTEPYVVSEKGYDFRGDLEYSNSTYTNITDLLKNAKIIN